MIKTDFKKKLDCYHAARGRFRLLEVPRLQYLMVDGQGDPNTSPRFASSIEALYPVAYALKFASKARGRDFVVMPLEGLGPPPHRQTPRDLSQRLPSHRT